MRQRVLGTLTIGQAPRPDVVPIIDRHVPASVRRIHRGVLDGLSRAEIDAQYRPASGEPALVTQLRDGTVVELSRRRMRDGVQHALAALEAEGCDVILLLCTGTFEGLACDKAWLVEPDHIIPGMVAGLIEHRQLGIIVPIAGQIESEGGKWRTLARPPIFATASPYTAPPEAVGDAGAALKSRGAQAILLDCIGFTERHRAALAGLALPIILSNAVAAKAVGELLGGGPTDDIGAFVPGQQFRLPGKPGGPLSGLTFAAKDLFDVAGHPTGGGNPDWARTHPVPARHAWAVQTLLDAGADLIGKTVTDEISLGILGENPFEGTPRNPRAPGRVPGGSSAGSAAAVAAGVCDIALGTDTGGSVRVPASFCGIHGIRPTHGRLDLSGMMSQAPSSDTTGWFARDAETFARVSAVMLGEAIPENLPNRLIVASDAFALADPETAAALEPLVARLGALVGEAREELLAPPGLAAWARAQRTLQPHEAWLNFREWIDRTNPRFQFSVARNLALAGSIPASERGWAALVREEARGRLRQLLVPGTILCLPTTPFPAPLCGQPLSALEPLRDRITALCAHGGLTGVPQVSIPGTTVEGLPVGLSIVGARGSDASLVALAQALEA